MTNFEKLTGWDADFYKSLSDEDCIVCLTEKQVYLLGQTLEQLTWFRTRWTGDKSDLDFEAIQADVQYRLRERMTCETLTLIMDTIEEIQITIQQIQNDINQDNIDPSFDVNETTISDVYTPQELADAGIEIDVCDTDGKNELYGACKQIVAFITQNNTDFLEQIEQSIGNVAEVASTLLAAFPPTNLITLDDLADQVQFITEELLEEYNATVDEALLQQTICDLFCIGVSRDCKLDFNNIFDYFSSKLPSNPTQFLTTWASVMQFAVIGSFSGDEYFYYLCWLQLFAALTGDGMYGSNPLNIYGLQLRAGANSPDNDWSILCDECPEIVAWSHNIDPVAAFYGDWSIFLGDQTASGLQVENNLAGAYQAILKIVLPASNTLLGAEFLCDNGGSGSGFGLRVNAGTDGNFVLGDSVWSGSLAAGVSSPCKIDFTGITFRQALIFIQQVGGVLPPLFLQRVKLQVLDDVTGYTFEYVVECFD